MIRSVDVGCGHVGVRGDCASLGNEEGRHGRGQRSRSRRRERKGEEDGSAGPLKNTYDVEKTTFELRCRLPLYKLNTHVNWKVDNTTG